MTHPWPYPLPQAFFLPADGGQRFCLFYPPEGTQSRGRVLYLHPFAEELNSTRRIVAQQARALAQAGYGVLLVDLLGCGDSTGDFADATWADWLRDAQRAYQWLMEHGNGPVWLWGMRSGTLLATQLADLLHGTAQAPIHLLLWQPVASGQQMLQQFLRLRAASQWLGAGNTNEPPPAQALEQGLTVNIAGYALSPALAQGLGKAQLLPPPSAATGRLVWLETSPQEAPPLLPSAHKTLATWQNAGWQVRAQAVQGPAFWQTVGTDEAPALIQATLEALAHNPSP